MSRKYVAVAVVALLLLAGAGTLFATLGQPDANRICRGVPAGMGGCDEPQPSYSATDCEGVGSEFAEQVEARQTVIMDGPPAVNDESRSVRLRNAMWLVAIRANQYLRDTGVIHACDSDRLVSVTDATVSESFKARVGDYLWDSPETHTYEEWLEMVRQTLTIVDMEKDNPEYGTWEHSITHASGVRGDVV